MHINNLSKFGSVIVGIGICTIPTVANALSLSFAPPTGFGSSFTINDKVSSKDTSNTLDTDSRQNIIKFNQTFSGSTGSINVSGTLFAQVINYVRNQNQTDFAFSVDGTQAIIFTLTDFNLTNNTTQSINLSNFLTANHTASFNNLSNPNTTANAYLSYVGSYSQTGTSTISGSYQLLTNSGSNNLTGASPSFSEFVQTSNISGITSGVTVNLGLAFQSVNLAAGASLSLPNSLGLVPTEAEFKKCDEYYYEQCEVSLTQTEVERLIELAREQVESQPFESVPEPSSLLGLLTLSGLFTLGSRKSKSQ